MKVEKSFPMPEDYKPDHVTHIKNMDVGDCLIIEAEDKKIFSRVSTYSRVHGMRENKKFSKRTILGDLHIWRTA